MQSIRNLVEKIKQNSGNSDIVIIIIIILTALASFGLGRLSKTEEIRTPISIENSNQSANLVTPLLRNDGEVIASKNGTKYYLPWCGGVKKISEANKVIFKNKEEAEKSGYTKASNCKGL